MAGKNAKMDLLLTKLAMSFIVPCRVGSMGLR